MEETFEITITYYPDDNYRNQISIRKVITKQEVDSGIPNIVYSKFDYMWEKINRAVFPTQIKKE